MYENNSLINPEVLNMDKNDDSLYSLSIAEIQNAEWRFILKKEIDKNAKSFSATMYLITKKEATINNIVVIASIFDNNELPYNLYTCISDSGLVTTRIVKIGSDLIINDTSIHVYDSLVRFYSLDNQKLLLKEERKFKKYVYLRH
jgi:hypothetical protein